MPDPFIGELRTMAFGFAPDQWAFCDGQRMVISQSTALFSLIATRFGGDGKTSFLLPNLSARSACGQGNGPGLTPRPLGESFGSAEVALQPAEMAEHRHGLAAYTTGRGASSSPDPDPNSALANARKSLVYGEGQVDAAMAAQSTSSTGGGQAHDKLQPALAMTTCIALWGEYPSFA